MRRLVPSLLTAALVGAATLSAVPAQASITVNQVFTVPASGAFTITGHGFGHGRGMSQYGAEGAARQGLDFRQILSFYYPGTSFSSVVGNIRVLISADTSRDVVVRTSPGLRVRDLGTGAWHRLPSNGASSWRLGVAPNGASTVQFHTDRWRTWSPGGRSTLVGDGEFTNDARIMTLVTPAGDQRYRGLLRGARPSAGSVERDTVNVLPIENYVAGVVPAEMPASWQPAAVQSQSVAARTYAMAERRARMNGHWQICDTTSCQVYKGVDGEHPLATAATRATARTILRYDGIPAFTQFSASSGGHTSQGNAPYLVAKPDPYDGWAGNGVHDWSVKVNESTIERAYPAIGELDRIRVTRREGGGDWGGRIEQMTFIGKSGSKTISGTELRSLYGLRSHWVWFAA